MPKHFQGGKFAASHTTVIDHAVPVLKVAEKLDAVTKITLGIIKRKHSRHPRLVCRDIAAGIQMTVIGTQSIQEIYLIVDGDRQSVKDALSKAFSS